MTNADLLKELQHHLRQADLAKLKPADAQRVLELVAARTLSRAHLIALLEVVPSFVHLAQQALGVAKAWVEAAKGSQVEALRHQSAAMEALSEALRQLAIGAQSDAIRAQIADSVIEAARLAAQIAEQRARMNADNNRVWRTLACVVVVVGGALLAALGGAYVASRSDAGSAS